MLPHPARERTTGSLRDLTTFLEDGAVETRAMSDLTRAKRDGRIIARAGRSASLGAQETDKKRRSSVLCVAVAPGGDGGR
jgi:hypothetical protein